MARTELGRRLTEKHKAEQVRLAAIASALTLANAKRLDVDDLDGTRDEWEARQLLIVETLRQRSAQMAARYVQQFRAAEGMPPGDVAAPNLRPAADVVAWVVPTIKARIAANADR